MIIIFLFIVKAVLWVNMHKYTLRELGEFRPGSFNNLNLNKLKEFVTVPYYIDWYKSCDSHKIYPLFIQEIESLNPTNIRIPGLIGRNPFFDHTRIKFFIAYDNGKPAGRILAFINYNYNRKYGNNTGWFGLFESIENKHVAEMLIDGALNYLRDNGCDIVIGPAKFNAGGEVGLLIKGFGNSPYFMEPYNAPYYKDFFEEYGMAKENDWYSIATDEIVSRNYLDRVEKVLEKFSNRKSGNHNMVKIREANFKDFKNEKEKIKKLYNDLWDSENHPQQVRMTDAEFDYLAMGIKAVSMENMIFMIEVNENPIGISVNIPDINEVIGSFDKNWPYTPSRFFLNPRDLSRDIKIFNQVQRKIKTKGFTRLRILLLGVEKKYRRAGIESRVFYKISKSAVSNGFKYASGSQLADINRDIINPIFRLGEAAFTWRVYHINI